MVKIFKVSEEEPTFYGLQISIDEEGIFIEAMAGEEVDHGIEIRKSEIPRLISVLQKIMKEEEEEE